MMRNYRVIIKVDDANKKSHIRLIHETESDPSPWKVVDDNGTLFRATIIRDEDELIETIASHSFNIWYNSQYNVEYRLVEIRVDLREHEYDVFVFDKHYETLPEDAELNQLTIPHLISDNGKITYRMWVKVDKGTTNEKVDELVADIFDDYEGPTYSLPTLKL